LRLFFSITMAFAFSALIGVASAGFGLASIARAACSRFVTRGVSRGAGSSGLAGSGALLLLPLLQKLTTTKADHHLELHGRSAGLFLTSRYCVYNCQRTY
jgi:hypothetical protein